MKMKKLIGLLVLLGIVILSSCKQRNSDGSWSLNEKPRNSTVTQGPYVEVIDSCEYIIWGYGMAHKGNCRFCENRRQTLPKDSVW